MSFSARQGLQNTMQNDSLFFLKFDFSLEVQPPFFIGLLPNHHYSGLYHHPKGTTIFSNGGNDFQGFVRTRFDSAAFELDISQTKSFGLSALLHFLYEM